MSSTSGSQPDLDGIPNEIVTRTHAQHDLRRSSDDLRALFEASPQAIIALDRQYRVTAWNAAAEHLFGWTAEEVLGRFNPLVREEDREEFLAIVAPIMHEGRTITRHEARRRRADGTWLDLSFCQSPLWDDDGSIRGIMAVVSDVTDRKQVEDTLWRREQEFRALAEHSPDVIVRFDHEFRRVYVNQAAERVTGIPREQLLGKTHAETGMSPDIVDFWQTHLSSVFATGEERTAEYRFPSGDEVLIFECRCVPEHADDGTIESILTVSRDVTERKHVEMGQSFLAEAGEILASSLDMEATLSQIVDLAVPELADTCSVTIADESGELRHLAAAHAGGVSEDLRQRIDQGVLVNPETPFGVAQVVRTGRSILYENVPAELLRQHADTFPQLAILQKIGIVSAMTVPLTVQDRTFGALAFIYGKSGRHYTPRDLALAEDLASRAAIAIENARLYREAQESERRSREQAERLAVLAEAVQIFAAGNLDLPRVLENVSSHISQLIGDMCVIRLLSPDRKWLEAYGLYHVDAAVREPLREALGAPRPADDWLVGPVIATGKPRRICSYEEWRALRSPVEDRESTDPSERFLKDLKPQTVVVVPLMVTGQVIGTLTVTRHTSSTPYTEDDEHFLQALADRAAQEIDNARLHREAREAEARYRALIEQIPAVTLTVADDVPHRALYVSPQVETLLGYPPEAWENHDTFWLELTHPEDRDRVRLEMRSAWYDGESFVTEYRMVRRDGATIWVRDEAVLILDDEGNRKFWQVIVTDITQQKQAEEEVRYQAHLLDVVDQAVIAVEADGTIVYWNRYAEHLYCWTREEALGMRAQDAITTISTSDDAEHIFACLQAGESWTGEFTVRNRDGREFPAMVTESPVFDEQGTLIGMVGVSLDISEQKRAAIERERLVRDLGERVKELTAIHRVSRLIQQDDLPVPALLRSIVDLIPAAMQFPEISAARIVHAGQEYASDGFTGTPWAVRVPFASSERLGGFIEVVYLECWPNGSPVAFVPEELAMLNSIGEMLGSHLQRLSSREAFRAAAQGSLDSFYLLSAIRDDEGTVIDFRFEDLNSRAEQLDKLTRQELIGKNLWEIYGNYEATLTFFAVYTRVVETGEPAEGEVQVTQSEHVEWLHYQAVPVSDGVACTVRDITDRKRAERMLRDAEARYRSLVENMPAVTYIRTCAEPSALTYVSPQVATVLGYTRQECESNAFWREVIHPDDQVPPGLQDGESGKVEDPFHAEYRVRARDGRTVWLRDEAVLVRDEGGTPLYWQGVLLDITDRKALEGELTHQAFHDALTGLPNRALFLDRARHARVRAGRTDGRIAILFLDLDNFKIVNDSLGHTVGDELLVTAAGRLRCCLRDGDTAARFGGDEFAVLLEDVPSLGTVTGVADRIVELFEEPFTLQGREVFITPSIGIAMSSPDGDNPDDLLRNADAAMYRAKRLGKARYEIFDPSLTMHALWRLELENDLRRAIERGEFVLHYHPLVNLESGAITGVEALVRWIHPTHGAISPKEFITIAEETGMILPLGRWVLREACRQASAWQREFGPHALTTMAVNLSARQFNDSHLVEHVISALDDSGLDPTHLVLEITESVMVEDHQLALQKLNALHDLGVSIAIDDFGTGYSSLAVLRSFPVDALKVAGSFVDALRTDPDDTVIVSGIIGLARGMDLQVVAEGIETASQLRQLRELGCLFGQGYYFGRPMTAEATRAVIATAANVPLAS